MPEWIKVIIGVTLLVAVSAGPGVWLALNQPHTTQSQRSPAKYGPNQTNGHDHDANGIRSQTPTMKPPSPTRESQTPKLNQSPNNHRGNDLNQKDDSVDNFPAWATVAVTAGLLIVAVVQARIYRNQAKIMLSQLRLTARAVRSAQRSAEVALSQVRLLAAIESPVFVWGEFGLHLVEGFEGTGILPNNIYRPTISVRNAGKFPIELREFCIEIFSGENLPPDALPTYSHINDIPLSIESGNAAPLLSTQMLKFSREDVEMLENRKTHLWMPPLTHDAPLCGNSATPGCKNIQGFAP
jgi:hypothetical protein